MSSGALPPADSPALRRFLKYYALLVGYFLARSATARGSEYRLVQGSIFNYAVPLSIVAWAARGRGWPLSRYGLTLSNSGRLLRHSAIGAALASAFVLGPAGKRMLGPRDEYERRLAGLSLREAVVLLGLTGLTEEVIWRGWVFAEVEEAFRLRSRGVRASAAIGASALLFSSFHLVNLAQWPRRRLGPELQQMAAAAALGVIGGYWRWWTGSIIPSMVTHDVANLLRWRMTRSALPREQSAAANAHGRAPH